MAHLTTTNLQKLCDILVTRPSWRIAMAQLGASEALAFKWRSQSIKAMADNDRSSQFFFEWRGTYDFFHCHAGRARLENIILYESVIRDQATNGIETPVLGPDQRPVYCEDPDLIDVSDEDLWGLLGRRNRYLRDAKGRPVPLTKIEQLPAPLRLRVLEQDRKYIERKEIDANVQVTAVAKPFERLPGEQAPSQEKIKRLLSLTPEQRRAELGASAIPTDSKGLVAQVARAAADPPRVASTRPSYARPTPTPTGMKVV